jgi:hypothetical protein
VEVAIETVDNNLRIDAESLASGVYLLEISTKKAVTRKRLIKQ